MTDRLDQGQLLLEEMKNEIIFLLQEGQVEAAQIFMDQYINLAPHTEDRYSLEAIINTEKNDMVRANKILLEGVRYHPLSFDLLYNLGYTFQELGEILEAYHIYLKAKYVAETEDEKKDIYRAFKSLGDDFAGGVRVDDKNAYLIIQAGKIELTFSESHDQLKKRKDLLHLVASNISEGSDKVLEIGFEDGVISRNLNFFGYDVTAVDPIKERIIEVIVRDWHGNILQPEEKSAKFYQEIIDIEWIKNIPDFDTIIAVAENNLERFQARKNKLEILESLISKSKNQLIIRVSKNESDTEFTKNELMNIVEKQKIHCELISSIEDDICEIYSVSKKRIKSFKIPSGLGVIGSKSLVLEVDLNKCTDLYGAGFIDDFHPFVAVLDQYAQDPDLEYKGSILKEYYKTFQPKNLEEGLFSNARELKQLKRGWIGYPWSWERNKKVIYTKKLKDTRPGGNHFHGPNTEEFGKEEFSRLVRLYNNLKIQGYQPEIFADGYISGYLLVMGDEYRFVVTEGQHRIAILASLGYEKILTKFTQIPEHNSIVDVKDIDKWAQVANKTFSRNLATKIFWRFFEEGVGRDRMGF